VQLLFNVAGTQAEDGSGDDDEEEDDDEDESDEDLPPPLLLKPVYVPKHVPMPAKHTERDKSTVAPWLIEAGRARARAARVTVEERERREQEEEEAQMRRLEQALLRRGETHQRVAEEVRPPPDRAQAHSALGRPGSFCACASLRS
jgi:hypothetical protein